MDEKKLETLPRFSWDDLTKHFDAKTPFEALSPMGTFFMRVKEYKPLVGLAVHAGHRIRAELVSNMGVEEDDRRYDEDTHSDYFIENFPMQLIGLDSRYEYDIDRKRDQAIYLKPFQCWGKRAWISPPTKTELEISYEKYDEAHDLMEFFMEQTMAYFHKTLVLDLHTYSFKRQMYGSKSSSLPLFNIGTTKLDRKKHAKTVDAWLAELAKIQVPDMETTVAENDLFKGDGAVAINLIEKFPEAAIIPLDIKKLFMDETTGQIHEPIAQKLRAEIEKIAQKLA